MNFETCIKMFKNAFKMPIKCFQIIDILGKKIAQGILYSKASFLVQIKFITEDSIQIHKRITILN